MITKNKENSLFVLFKAMRKKKIAILIFAVLKMTSVLCFILILPMVLNKVVGEINSNAFNAVFAITFTYILRATINLLSDLLKATIVPTLESEIKRVFFRYAQETTEQYDSGKIADLIDKSTSSLVKMYNVFFQSILPSFFLVVVVIVGFSKKNIKLSISTFIWILLHSMISIVIYKMTKPLYIKSMEIHNGIQGFIVDNFTNRKIELFFHKKQENMEKFSMLQEEERKTESQNQFLITFLVLLKECNTILIQGAFFIKILLSSNTSAAEFLMLFHINRSTILYIGHLTERIPEFIEGYSKANNMRSVIEEELPPRHIELRNPKGNITIKNLHVIRDGKTIINNFSINFYAGQKVAIVGQSGEGKSTFLNSIAGICQYDGEIFIDNINLNSLTRQTINENFSYVFSSQTLLNNSLKYNITLGNPMKKEEILKIMEKSSLGHLKDRINESSNNLSSGEKKRVVFARSLWNCEKSSIFLADEPFANLDQLTARNILKTLLEVSNNKTTLVVDHLKTFLEYSDTVLFFFGNHIYVGTHKSLLSNPLYQQFVESTE